MRHQTLLTLALTLSGLLLGACNKAPEAPKSENTAPLLLAAEDLIELSPSALANGPVVTGSIQAARRADLRAEVPALVLQVLKENGEAVRQGDVLVRLDDATIRDNLASAEAAVRASQLALTQAERQLQRLQTLRGSGMASLQALDDTEVKRNNATSELAAAKSRQAQAQQQLLRTVVRAPFDGIVAERKVSAGDTAQVGKELLKVIDPVSLRFDGFVSADQLAAVRVGQPVMFRVNGYGDTEFAGRLTRRGAVANPVTRQLEVQVGFDGKAQPGIAGLFAEGRIATGEQALTLPASAIVRDGDQAHAWRFDGSALHKQALKLGTRDPRRGDYVVLEGLAAGARVLRYPAVTLKDGQAAQAAAATPATTQSGAS